MRLGQRLEQVDGDNRYELTVEVEAGSRRDAADELLVGYENASAPIILGCSSPSLRSPGRRRRARHATHTATKTSERPSSAPGTSTASNVSRSAVSTSSPLHPASVR